MYVAWWIVIMFEYEFDTWIEGRTYPAYDALGYLRGKRLEGNGEIICYILLMHDGY